MNIRITNMDGIVRNTIRPLQCEIIECWRGFRMTGYCGNQHAIKITCEMEASQDWAEGNTPVRDYTKYVVMSFQRFQHRENIWKNLPTRMFVKFPGYPSR